MKLQPRPGYCDRNIGFRTNPFRHPDCREGTHMRVYNFYDEMLPVVSRTTVIGLNGTEYKDFANSVSFLAPFVVKIPV